MLVYGDPRTANEGLSPPAGEPFAPGVLREAFFRLLRIVGPVAALAVFVLGVHVFAPQLLSKTLTLFAIYTAPFGMEASVPFALGMGVPPLFLVALMFLFDMAIAATLLLNMEYAKGLPLLGRWVTRLETASLRLYGKHPWLQRAGFAGLILFVFLPMAGTGSSVGAAIGKLTGMGAAKTIAAVLLGTLARVGLLVGFAAGALSIL